VKKHGSVLQGREEKADKMANRTTLLLIVASLSVTLGWPTRTLHAQQPEAPFSPSPYHSYDRPSYSPPFWLELLKNHPHLALHLAALLVAAAVLIPIGIVFQSVRIILGLIDVVAGRQPAHEPALARKVISNNLKELVLAMMNYHDYSDGRLPLAVLRDQELGNRGQPYSWRVALLPFLGEGELFSQYRRDEPWDSPANKAVLARMPRVFAAPGSARAEDGFTHYQVLVGPGTAFERPDLRVVWGDFQRGASQTILIVEATDPIPWTKPEDLSYAPDGPLPKVGGLVGNGFHAMFADGHVRWIEADQQESALRTLVPLKGR
jgi:prepilin-type processing-associated H-X9-DG protein